MIVTFHLLALGCYGVATACALATVVGNLVVPRAVALGAPLAGAAFHVAAVSQLKLAGLDSQARQQFGVPEEVNGVLVVDVESGSVAADQGVQPGDVIVQIANQRVSSPQEARERIEAARNDKRRAVLFLLNRRGGERFVAVPLERA